MKLNKRRDSNSAAFNEQTAADEEEEEPMATSLRLASLRPTLPGLDKSQHGTEDSEYEEDDICHETRNLGFTIGGINLFVHVLRDV